MSTALCVNCDERKAAVCKPRSILRTVRSKALGIEDRELAHCLLSVAGRTVPFGREFAAHAAMLRVAVQPAIAALGTQGSKPPQQAMKDWYQRKPDLLNRQPRNQLGCDI